VTSVDSATAGLEQLAKGDIDVIMSDWVMPQIDGLEFARLAKGLYPATPFILVTGFAEKLISRVPPGVDLLMLKPVSFGDIGHGIESVMSEGGQS
jgi:CheY-like chemotaxis protein